MYWHLGNCCFNYVRSKNHSVSVKMVTYTTGRQIEIKYRNGVLGIPKMISNLCEDEVRNVHICDIVLNIRQRWPDRKGLLLSDRVEHLKALHRILGAGLSTEVTGSYRSDAEDKGDSDLSKKRKDNKRKKEGHIDDEGQYDHKEEANTDITKPGCIQVDTFLTLSTYHLFSEAVDFNGDFIVLSTPRSKVEQSIGRITRGRSTVHSALIIDIVDPYSLFENMKWIRYKTYKAMGYMVKFTTPDIKEYHTFDWIVTNPIQICTKKDECGIVQNTLLCDDTAPADRNEESESGKECFVTHDKMERINNYFKNVPNNRLLRTTNVQAEYSFDLTSSS